MADNEHPNQPVPYDPEQQRQFEQFQQYQQFLKYQETQGQLPPGAPAPGPKKPPLWQKVLRSKMFRKLVLLAIVIIGLIWAYDYYFGPDPDDSTVQGGAGPGSPAQQMHVENPKAGITTLYGYVSAGQQQTCQLFEPLAAQQFANDMGARDCAAAVAQLRGTVDPGATAPQIKFTSEQTVTVSSCTDVKAKPGTKLLGEITFTKRTNGWLISKHDPEPDPCPAPTTGPTATTKPSN